ncbi:MAG: 4a-hydroxytetrahydrobiopterin dehydratase [Crocinitomicaceae bacterium]
MMNWKEEHGYLTKTYELNGFKEITEALTKIADKADEMQHHPDVEIFEYKKVKFKLMTHDQGKITEKDHQMAQKIDHILK